MLNSRIKDNSQDLIYTSGKMVQSNQIVAKNRKRNLKKKLRKVKRKKTTTTPAPVEEAMMMMTPPWESAVKELGSGQTITPWTPPSPVVPARTAEEMTRGAAFTLGEFAPHN